ncbi:hypothetical protein PCASD_23586 [Puccinia coronata f. sp. avenae]|uniref:Uncharacterized protein n=1 Tax=Puccinia coronata f. sp. avenae TaxID=200324 RepID=A0A2N5TUY2_9BASI|nr:hypothetical protein PCASD_23586 [Puccinia coronata f. sp. avenae]
MHLGSQHCTARLGSFRQTKKYKSLDSLAVDSIALASGRTSPVSLTLEAQARPVIKRPLIEAVGFPRIISTPGD